MSKIVIEYDKEMETEGELDIAELFRKYGSDKDNNGYSHLYSINTFNCIIILSYFRTR